MKTLKYAAAFLMFATSTFSQAKYYDNFYLGVGLNTASYDVENPTHRLEGNLNALNIIAGISFNPYVSIEGRYGFGLLNDSYTVDAQSVEARLASFYGAYLKTQFGMYDLITPYALFGYSKSSLDSDSNITGGFKNKQSDLSFGLGLAFNFFPIAFTLEYMDLLGKKSYELSTINLGFYYKF